MLKHSLIFTVLALLCFSCTKQPSAPIELTWQHLGNDIDKGICESRFVVTNISSDTLYSDWAVFFNQMSVSPLVYDSCPLQVNQIQASYHSLTPTEYYQPIPPHDSLSVVIRYRGNVMRQSMSPQGPFFVSSHRPVSVNIRYLYSSDGHEFRRSVPVFPYADGEWMFRQNERVAESSPLASAMNIFPTPKSIQYYDDVCKKDDASVIFRNNADINAEGYTLEITADSIVVSSSDESGRFYALKTLARLRENYGRQLPCCMIEDFPDVAHRGLMLDIARNFTDKDEIIRIVDVLADYKMNVFHLHLTDDEGWRLEIPGLPELTDVGARRGYTENEHECLIPLYSGGFDPNDTKSVANGFLTRNDFIQILRHAKSQHVRIVPEIDMPGHSRAAIKAMEARYWKYIVTDSLKATEYLLTDFADTSRYVSAQHYTDNVICIALPSCYTFVRKVIDEVVAMYREADAPLGIFHVGGDEVPRGAWLGSPVVAEYLRAQKQLEQKNSQPANAQLVNEAIVNVIDVANLKDSFLESLIAILDGYGLQVAGWEEIAYRGGHPNPRFANRNALTYCWNSVPEWRGDEKPYTLANAGYPVMLCCVTNLYIDMCYVNHEEETGLNWGGYVDEYQSFLFRPDDLYRSVERTMLGKRRNLEEYAASDKTPLVPDSAKNIKGVQAQLWSETVRSAAQLERYLFPKLLGVAQRAWTSDFDFGEKENLLEEYNYVLWQNEIPRLHKKGIAFHLSQPGIHREPFNMLPSQNLSDEAEVAHSRAENKGENLVVMNTAVSGAQIRYTLDGSKPTEKSMLYTSPFVSDAPLINAAAFYLGEKSNTTHSQK